MKGQAMKKDIKEAIEKNLPQAVGEELRERLEKADEDASTLKDLRAAHERHTKQIREMEAEARGFHERKGALDLFEEELIKREKDITTLELTARFETEKRELVHSMFNQVFSNRIVREDVLTTTEHVSVKHRATKDAPFESPDVVQTPVTGSKSTTIEEG